MSGPIAGDSTPDPAPEPAPDRVADAPSSPEVAAFWEVARVRARLDAVAGELAPSPLGLLQPPAWSFGATPDQADSLLALVLDGTKTATAGALWDYEAEGEDVPTVGELSILLDSGEHPRALVVTTRRCRPLRPGG